MSSIAITPGLFRQPADQTKTATSPPKRRQQPVLIFDAVTPWREETLLLDLLRRQAYEDMDSDQS